MPIEGFLVVQRNRANADQTVNPKYRGIDRLPPWSLEHYEQGFDDPYVFSNARDSTGLLSTRLLALDFRHRFREIRPDEQLEIIFVRIGEPTPISWGQFLGFDVADHAPPFYSPLGDPPVGADVDKLLARLNENGLFVDIDSATEYLPLVRARLLPEDPSLAIWNIYYVE